MVESNFTLAYSRQIGKSEANPAINITVRTAADKSKMESDDEHDGKSDYGREDNFVATIVALSMRKVDERLLEERFWPRLYD
jgi:hypothetical protein